MTDEFPKWHERIQWLSHHKGEIACFWCSRCRKQKNYDVDSMLKVLGDVNVPSLPDIVSKAVGCPNFAKVGWDRCQMAPARPEFQKIEWTPEVKIPRGYLPLGERTLSGILEWEIVFAKCRCGWMYYVDTRALLRKYGAQAKTDDLEKLLKCRRCEKRGRAIFIFRNEKR